MFENVATPIKVDVSNCVITKDMDELFIHFGFDICLHVNNYNQIIS